MEKKVKIYLLSIGFLMPKNNNNCKITIQVVSVMFVYGGETDTKSGIEKLFMKRLRTFQISRYICMYKFDLIF